MGQKDPLPVVHPPLYISYIERILTFVCEVLRPQATNQELAYSSSHSSFPLPHWKLSISLRLHRSVVPSPHCEYINTCCLFVELSFSQKQLAIKLSSPVILRAHNNLYLRGPLHCSYRQVIEHKAKPQNTTPYSSYSAQ